MDTGRDFLRAQLNNSIAQHGTLIDSIRDHAEQGEEPRFRQLCLQYLPALERHQGMLTQYGTSIGAESGGGFVKGAIGAVLGKARGAVDSMRDSDFLRIVADIVMIRQSQDTFRTFAVAGAEINEPQLAELGSTAEVHHDAMQRDFNELAAELFALQVNNGADAGIRDASRSRTT